MATKVIRLPNICLNATLVIFILISHSFHALQLLKVAIFEPVENAHPKESNKSNVIGGSTQLYKPLFI